MIYIIGFISTYLLLHILSHKERYFSCVDKYIYKYVSPLIVLPLVFFALGTIGQMVEIDDAIKDFSASIICVQHIFGWMSIFYLCDRGRTLISMQKNFLRIILLLLTVMLSLTINYTSQFYLLYGLSHHNFKYISEGQLNILFDFFFYSGGILISNNTSSICADSLWAKYFSFSLAVQSFILLVLVLANYERIFNFIKDKT